ncbi:MAG: type II toxin-antitoxin system RelE/ParE family toxin [Nitrospiraceae bacterium]|nr:type II toxin-antitoxin system RelE/ParE family toxin [Nitrospiraceae bacterium]
MSWSVVFDERLEKWLNDIPADIKARIINITDLLIEHGPQNVREPYVKHIHGKLFEIRAKGKDGIARVFYFTMTGQRIVLLHGFIKKTQKTPKKEIDTAAARMNEILAVK